MKYDDGTIVRIGQNTIFSFEANTRTLNLKKGTFVFYMPKGLGGGTIKTPSLTAAITGTIGKVSVNTIAIIEGTVKLLPGGQLVHAGQFARLNPDGTITIGDFDPASGLEGKLMTFNGPLPGLPDNTTPTFTLGTPPTDDLLQRGLNLPSGVFHFNPPPGNNPPPFDRTKTGVRPPPPPPSSNPNNKGY